jgi:hypothetical protein
LLSKVPAPHIQLITPSTPAELLATRHIFEEYARQLGIDLCFQNFDAELAELPGDYAEPSGALLLAMVNGELAGCCAMRPLDSDEGVAPGFVLDNDRAQLESERKAQPEE